MAFAVFFGFVFLGLIYLYVKTRDTWNWKKIALWFGGILIALVLAMVVAIFADSFKKIVPTISTTISTYDGITLGDKLSDVEFKKGKLKKIQDRKPDEDDFYYADSVSGVYVNNTTKLVTGIIVDCSKYVSSKFNGIGCGDSSESIQVKFKGEFSELCQPEDTKVRGDPLRVYDVPKYGVRYVLQKNAVVTIILRSKDFWTENKTQWIACK